MIPKTAISVKNTKPPHSLINPFSILFPKFQSKNTKKTYLGPQFEYEVRHKCKSEMALQHTLGFQKFLSPVKEYKFKDFPSAAGTSSHSEVTGSNTEISCCSSHSSNFLRVPLQLQGGRFRNSGVRASRTAETFKSGDGKKKKWEESSDSDEDDDSFSTKKGEVNDPYQMDAAERREWRRNIREVIDKHPDIEEELNAEDKKIRMQKLLADYPLVVEEDDPDWPEDSDGWGFNLGQFFNKITIKNKKKDDDDENYDSENEIVWQDDNYIRPIKDITTADWEETVFKDINPLIILVHNRYKRPKENEKARDELEKAVNIIWNCRLPSPRCVAVDAVVETDLVSALKVSIFPEIIFTKAGKILYRERGLNVEYDEICGRIIGRNPQPPIGEVFAVVRREESQRPVMLGKRTAGSTASMEGSALAIPKAQVSSRTSHNQRAEDKNNLQCDYCGKPRHTCEKCWKLHGKPPNGLELREDYWNCQRNKWAVLL
ncbi:uncharacterized protein LOC8261697 isoform X3 [Ricinus communis]|uniref:uncharacterized protein LOC8261697 isoform X3 n=1 Tax=Ricinus communis TaxID=3988 RepID=UPI00201A509D|nr:uncharacterized protein LOC8261697 isoform X3 [Ricinus communis]